MPPPDLGSIDCNLTGPIVAGSYQTCVLTYTAGFSGIDDTGSLKIVMRYATDAGAPQFDHPQAPNYTTAVASNDAVLLLRYDIKDNVRPWGKTLYVKVVQGYLRQGDQIRITIGDASGGSPGWRMQTFREETLELRLLVDRYATYVYERVPNPPELNIVAGEPVRLVAAAPSLARPGEPIIVRWKLEDLWGNPVGEPRQLEHPGFEAAGRHTVAVRDEESGLEGESNPIVVGEGDGYGRFWADLHGQSEETIGSNTIDDYFRFGRDWAFLDACAHQGNDFQITETFWRKIQATTREFYQPGRFVTFPGWEWSGNTGLGGDRNVLYREEGGIISRSCRALVPDDEADEADSANVEDLFDRLEGSDPPSMLIAHVGGRYADLARHREGLELAVEVHSAWGTFEWMLDDAFSRGYRVAIVGNSDGHKGRPGASYPGAGRFGSYGGLTCILAERLDRESVWEAYQARRVYATTGARIWLDVVADDGVRMGEVLEAPDHRPEFRVTVHGTAPIERVEFRNGMRVLRTLRPYAAADLGNRVKVLWEGAEVRGRGRQVSWDGGLRVTGNRIRGFETVNFLNPERPCRQTGPRRLEWQSITTGATQGVILDLEKRGGSLEFRSEQKNFRLRLGDLGARGRTFRAGGLGKQVSVYRLPEAGGARSLEFTFRPAARQLHSGDNPLYVCVVQEDGHMAWSSPVYVVRS